MKHSISSFRSKDRTRSIPLFPPQNYFYNTSVHCKHLNMLMLFLFFIYTTNYKLSHYWLIIQYNIFLFLYKFVITTEILRWKSKTSQEWLVNWIWTNFNKLQYLCLEWNGWRRSLTLTERLVLISFHSKTTLQATNIILWFSPQTCRIIYCN